ncbi:MAG: methylated-DNA--[protein]-cysteine S-methyltransferase [Robiginitalea sp.]|jgi:methylated-DNA-[protein]-cysteine S-methyltransferase
MEKAIIDTPLGTACITGDSSGIFSVKLTQDQKISDNIPVLLQPACNQLEEYFRGTRKTFELLLNPQGTEFQQRVWMALSGIPYGKTTSYLQLARELGDPRAVRAVAAANAKNPLWIVLPCHRVIGSDGDLRGYAGGLDRKKWLLNHESPHRQASLFEHQPTKWSEI